MGTKMCLKGKAVILGATRWIICFTALLCAVPLAGGETHEEPPQALTGEQFMLANALWTLLHETAHAVINELDILFLGSEEDAADQLATIALLRHEPDFGAADGVGQVETVIAAATAWRIEWELEKREGSPAAYWDSHSLSIQRFYNMMCLLYGSDPDKYDKVQQQLGLPYERAWACVDYENKRAQRAVQRIIDTHSRQQRDGADRGKISVVYEKPLPGEHQQIAAAIRQAGIAERLATRTEKMLVLPKDITIVFARCDNDATAFWRQDSKEIVMCYELLSRFLYLYQAKQCLEMTAMTDEELTACLVRKAY
jgi:hypothetical protein